MKHVLIGEDLMSRIGAGEISNNEIDGGGRTGHVDVLIRESCANWQRTQSG